MLRTSDRARSTPVLLAGGFAGLAGLASCMAFSAGLLAVTVSTSADSSQQTSGMFSGGTLAYEPQTATPSSEPLLPLYLPCGQSFRHELLPHSNVTWQIEGQPGDVLSLHYLSASDSSDLRIDLQLEDESLIQARGGASSSDTQSFLLPRQATYSFTLISDESGVDYEIALACGGLQPLPSPTPTSLPTPQPTPIPRSAALRSRTGEIKAAGDLVVSLLWMSMADLDLHVIDPRGEEIYFENPRSLTGGLLEYEANGSCLMDTTEPLESIFWKAGTAPSGKYQVIVDYYGTCENEAEQEFVVGVWIDGELVEMVEGSVGPQTLRLVHEFGY
ncbi:MAG: hypothetical protein V3S30_03150 [Thermoanaerobaculia bacterium]